MLNEDLQSATAPGRGFRHGAHEHGGQNERVARPIPTPLFHFTHLRNLPTIMSVGLFADSLARAGSMQVEIADQEVKARRRTRPVRVGRGGYVGDYVPFYYAPRSPTMYVINRGDVSTYQGGFDDVVYLATTVEALLELALDVVFCDRNAAKHVAAFSTDIVDLDSLVDWPLMRATMWNNTGDDSRADGAADGRVPGALARAMGGLPPHHGQDRSLRRGRSHSVGYGELVTSSHCQTWLVLLRMWAHRA